jgi:uncharacterized protein (UPF0147 family)
VASISRVSLTNNIPVKTRSSFWSIITLCG